MKNIAIIPARGRSKRIPRKNIKDFFGKPIIAYSIETAIKSKLFDEVMVSTDDFEIAEIAKKYGAKVPFLRSKETSDDHTGLADVITEVLEKYRLLDIEFENVCCILATAPFIIENDLRRTFNILDSKEINSVFPVVKYSFPIQRAMRFDDGIIKMVWPENKTKRSQDLEPSYHDAGLFYWIRTNSILEEGSLWNDKTTAVEVSEQTSQDIDTIEDWEIAEIKYKILNAK